MRLRLFQVIVTPTVLYSLSSSPLTKGEAEKLDAAQRKMLRKIVGWVRFDEETWETTGHRMKARLEAALERYPLKSWSSLRAEQRDALVEKARNQTSTLLALSFYWDPVATSAENSVGKRPHRARAHPRQRWTD